MNKMKSLFKNESGNAVVIVLVALVVIAVGALAYLSGQMAGEQIGQEDTAPSQQTAAAQALDAVEPVANADAAPDAQAADQPVIEPGNPVVAKVGDIEVMRSDVVNFVQSLPPETRNLPAEQLFPLAQDQVINARIVQEKTKGVKVDENEDFKRQMEIAREQIAQRIYIENLVNEKMTEDRLKKAYDEYVKEFPDVEEVKAAHILVKEEDRAKEALEKLKAGGDFATLAKEYSYDKTSENGGDLGYFLKTDVVPEFGEAAFAMAPGSFSQDLVKTQFGFHIIKVDEKRKRAPADFETAKPFLEAQLRQIVLEEILNDWRDDFKVERFDINGKVSQTEPAAGQE
jgi:peptidyl-prolyl cis-trans isomerase C